MGLRSCLKGHLRQGPLLGKSVAVGSMRSSWPMGLRASEPLWLLAGDLSQPLTLGNHLQGGSHMAAAPSQPASTCNETGARVSCDLLMEVLFPPFPLILCATIKPLGPATLRGKGSQQARTPRCRGHRGPPQRLPVTFSQTVQRGRGAGVQADHILSHPGKTQFTPWKPRAVLLPLLPMPSPPAGSWSAPLCHFKTKESILFPTSIKLRLIRGRTNLPHLEK